MQPVSQLWKNNQQQTLVTESFVEISMKVGDPDVQKEADVADNGHEIISNTIDVVEQTTEAIKYATLEPFIWTLDGSCDLIGIDGEDDEYEGFIPKGETETLITREDEEFDVAV